MTDTPATSRAPRAARKPLPSALNVITAGLGLFLVILTLLALQVRSGRDPSLSRTPSGTVAAGSKAATAATKSVVTKTS